MRVKTQHDLFLSKFILSLQASQQHRPSEVRTSASTFCADATPHPSPCSTPNQTRSLKAHCTPASSPPAHPVGAQGAKVLPSTRGFSQALSSTNIPPPTYCLR